MQANRIHRNENNAHQNSKKDVYKTINEKYPDGNVMLDGSALLIYGEK